MDTFSNSSAAAGRVNSTAPEQTERHPEFFLGATYEPVEIRRLEPDDSEANVVESRISADNRVPTGPHANPTTDLQPYSSDSELDQPAEHRKFNTSSTYTSFGLIGVYTALNVTMAHTLRNNPAAAIPVIYNLTGYLPQLAAQTYDSFKHDEALVLDATMYTKIIGAGVVSGVQVIVSRHVV